MVTVDALEQIHFLSGKSAGYAVCADEALKMIQRPEVTATEATLLGELITRIVALHAELRNELDAVGARRAAT